MLKVEGIFIHGINGIFELGIKLNPGFNFISGENGIGKTTILECIASSFNRNTRNLRKNVLSNRGFWETHGFNDGEHFVRDFEIAEIEMQEKRGMPKFRNSIRSKEMVNFSVNRNIPNGFYGSQLDSIQSWFFRNYYNEQRISEKRYSNLMIAQKCFKKLDSKIRFSRIEKRDIQNKDDSRMQKFRESADIYIETPSGEIPLNYLSSGYKSCLNILLGLIRQTEVTHAYKDVHTYDGVILIDELDLHLHPEWQAKLIEILRWLVPNAQVIAATHSPHIIQAAYPNEVIPLKFENGLATVNQKVYSKEYGFQGWSIEEILQDVMGLKNTHSDLHYQLLREFNEALNNLDIRKANYYYDKIDKLLHPDNHLRKIFKIQLSSLGGLNID
ncbi:AAA family ATPase [Bacillus cereus]|uniref:AAA family ATPase n=1 Tax=Bacillus cereus TaxID=1396 RepID=UPI002360E6DD|nr:AAA family ATPase [Bacillus cereus]MDD0821024.1 AAA family ATPase [Bacillus cereus]